MTLTIDLPQAIEMRLEAEARKQGVTIPELVCRTLTERFHTQPDEDAQAQAQALCLIAQWIIDAPDSPQMLQDDEGARLLYPGLE